MERTREGKSRTEVGQGVPGPLDYYLPTILAICVFLALGGFVALREVGARDEFVVALGSVVGLLAVGHGVHMGARHIAHKTSTAENATVEMA